MPTTMDDYQAIKERQQKAREVAKESSLLKSEATDFGADVWDRIHQARSQRGIDQLAKGVGRTSEQLASQGQEVRSRLRGEVNPMDVIDITKADRARALGTLSTLATAREQRAGTLSDVIGAGTNRLKAAATAKQAEARQASQEAQDMIDLVKLKEQREAQDFKEWYKRQLIKQKWAGIAQDMGGGMGKATTPDEVESLVTSMGDKDRRETEDYTAAIRDLSSLKKQLEEAKTGGKISDWLTGQTGLFSRIGGAYRPGHDLRNNLDRLKAKIQNEFYGSALTESEIKQANRWLIGSGKQETKNYHRISGLLDEKINELTSKLEVSGSSRPGALQYVYQTGNVRPRLQGPDGTTYEYDNVNDPDYVEDLQKGFVPIY